MLGSFLNQFQTLVTGILAVGGVFWATRPVIQQMQDGNLMARISHRETLDGILGDALGRYNKMSSEIESPISNLEAIILNDDGSDNEIEPNDAFGMEQRFSYLSDWYFETLKDTESVDIESAKNEFVEENILLQTFLREIYQPYSLDNARTS